MRAMAVASHVNIFHNFINYIPGPVHNSYSLPVHFRTQGAEIEMMTSCSIRARLRGGLESSLSCSYLILWGSCTVRDIVPISAALAINPPWVKPLGLMTT